MLRCWFALLMVVAVQLLEEAFYSAELSEITAGGHAVSAGPGLSVCS